MRLIDADALCKRCKELDAKCTGFDCEVTTMPTIEAKPAWHGKWEKASEWMPIYRCSICKERNLFKNGDNVFSKYCPSCGALMNQEERE